MKNRVSKLIEKYNNLPIGLRATFWFLICSFLQRGISVITTPIFTRILSTAEYGEFNVFNSWLSILTVIVTLNLPWGVYPQGLVKFEERRKSFSSTLQGLCLTLVIFWSAIYFAFQKQVNSLLHLSTSKMIAMMLMMWASSVFYFWSASERVEFKYRNLVILTLVVSVLQPVLSILLIYRMPDKVLGRIWGLAIVELVCYSWLFLSQMRKGHVFCDIKTWKYALAFNVTLIPHYLSQTVLSGADRIMIERLVSNDKAGIYSLAYSLSLIMLVFNSSLGQTINPWIYKQIKNEKVSDIKKIVYPSIIGVATLNLMLILFAPEIVRIFAPASYYEAIWVIPPITMSVFFMFLYDMFSTFEFYYEKTKFMSVATVLGAVLNIILNYIFIRIFGYYAAGYTTLFCYICYAVFHYCVMRFICLKDKEKPYDLKFILLVTCAFLIFGFMALLTYNNIATRYTLVGLTAVLLLIKRKKIVEFVIRVTRLKSKNDA